MYCSSGTSARPECKVSFDGVYINWQINSLFGSLSNNSASFWITGYSTRSSHSRHYSIILWQFFAYHNAFDISHDKAQFNQSCFQQCRTVLIHSFFQPFWCKHRPDGMSHSRLCVFFYYISLGYCWQEGMPVCKPQSNDTDIPVAFFSIFCIFWDMPGQ